MCLAIRESPALALTTAQKCAMMSKVALDGPSKKGRLGFVVKVRENPLSSTNQCWLKTINAGVIFDEDWVSGGPGISK